MKIFFTTIFFIAFCAIVYAQDVDFVGETLNSKVRFYRLGKKKCPGIISHNNCFRFISIKSYETPRKNLIKECDFDLKYNFRLNDTLVLLSLDFENLKNHIRDNDDNLYKKIENIKVIDYNEWIIEKVVDRSNYSLDKYYIESTTYLIFSVNVYLLNSKILAGNIYINRDFTDFVTVIVPVLGNGSN